MLKNISFTEFFREEKKKETWGKKMRRNVGSWVSFLFGAIYFGFYIIKSKKVKFIYLLADPHELLYLIVSNKTHKSSPLMFLAPYNYFLLFDSSEDISLCDEAARLDGEGIKKIRGKLLL